MPGDECNWRWHNLLSATRIKKSLHRLPFQMLSRKSLATRLGLDAKRGPQSALFSGSFLIFAQRSSHVERTKEDSRKGAASLGRLDK